MKNFSRFVFAAVSILFASAIALNVGFLNQIVISAPLVQKTPVILDDDGSQDGMTAWAYMLAHPQFEVKALTLSQGVAHPNLFADNVDRMLKRLEITDIPLGIGGPDPLAGSNQFPAFIRDNSDTFWSPFVTLPDKPFSFQHRNAAELIVETINHSPSPVAILATGPLTNIAEALRLDPTILDNISAVQIMGGAIFVPGNLSVLSDPPFSSNTAAEFNIWVDPLAAQEVFDAGNKGLKIQLTPLDATNQIQFTRSDQAAWIETGTPESKLAAEFLDFAITVIQSDNDPNPVWDLVAALNLTEPDFSPETPLSLDVDTQSAPGETQGGIKVISGASPNVLVSLNPSFDNLPYKSGEIFAAISEPVSAPESVD
ncbi:MAG: nucleoside hydrolase [Leptolyngbyaceae cyanobacterium MO_188.B28]|nr:nucleoside hydrolase [Leptolyngbyaceae cyanobacterium MO_188.B28]